MKKKHFIYSTTVFSLGINTILSSLLSLPGVATTYNSEQNLPNISSSIVGDKDKFSFEANTQNLSLRDRGTFEIAHQAYNGKASWYGPKFHGRRTANGEIFNSNAMTAAHRSLPFGTKVRVTNLNNGRSVVVRINDRGPFIKGRIIDVSAGAARVLNMMNSGVANVKIEILGR